MRLHRFHLFGLISGIFLIILFGTIQPLIRVSSNTRKPQLILVLGGDLDREFLGLKIANRLKLPILITGGSNPEYSQWMVKEEGIDSALVRRDYRAKDTLSNFTSIVDDLAEDGINHILLITSEYHIDRAMLIGSIIAGSRGIRLSKVSVPCSTYCKEESNKKYYIDLIRAIAWVTTGKDLKDIFPHEIKLILID